MKIGIVLQSNKREHIWNTFRFANTALKAAHAVRIVLMNEGVEAEEIANTEQFDISKKIEEFKKLGGLLFACETCLKIRLKEKSEVCPVTQMDGVLKIVEESDKLLVFG